MALSFKSVQKAYEIFNILKQEMLPQLRIPSWPADMGEWDQEKKENPPTLEVLGWGKKSDDGWETISFYIENPSKELKERFEELVKEIKIPNTHINKRSNRNNKLWIIGWF